MCACQISARSTHTGFELKLRVCVSAVCAVTSCLVAMEDVCVRVSKRCACFERVRADNANFVVTEDVCVCPNTALQIKFPEGGFVCVWSKQTGL